MTTETYTLITGASSGFGKSLALECASRKMNLILVALPGPELNELADSIRMRYGVKAMAVEKDLSTEEGCYSLHSEVIKQNLRVNILINNAGVGSTFYFYEGGADFFEKQVKLNVLATTLLTRLFLPLLEQHHQSYILNVSSLSCFFHLPRKSVYGSTKTYIYYLSRTLKKELRPHGVSVSVICPGGMNTNAVVTQVNQSGTWFARHSAMEPDVVAAIAISGMLSKKEVIIPGKLNKLYKMLDYVVPSSVKDMVQQYQMKKLKRSDVL
ncbi:MAG: SDR family NAD(P)-dependent oxidoreductase [Lacibacter sp.]